MAKVWNITIARSSDSAVVTTFNMTSEERPSASDALKKYTPKGNQPTRNQCWVASMRISNSGPTSSKSKNSKND